MTSAVKRKGESNDSTSSKLSVARQQHIAVLRCLKPCLLDDTTLGFFIPLPVLDIIASYSIDRSVITVHAAGADKAHEKRDDVYTLATAYRSDSIVIVSKGRLASQLLRFGCLSGDMDVLCSLDVEVEAVYMFNDNIYLTSVDVGPPTRVRFWRYNSELTGLDSVSSIETPHPYEHSLIGIQNVLYDMNTDGVFRNVLTGRMAFQLNKNVYAVASSRHPRDVGQDVLFVVDDSGKELIRVEVLPITGQRRWSILQTFIRPIEAITCSPSGHVIVAVASVYQYEGVGQQLYFVDPYVNSVVESTSLDRVRISTNPAKLLAGLDEPDDLKDVPDDGHPLKEAEFFYILSLIVNDTN